MESRNTSVRMECVRGENRFESSEEMGELVIISDQRGPAEGAVGERTHLAIT